MPVSFTARRSRVSSMFNVVLICINMHVLCIYVKSDVEIPLPPPSPSPSRAPSSDMSP
jgi:hypothetical protein